jgi:hypothetical protein
MKYVLLIGLMGLAIAFGLGVLATSPKNSLASVESRHSASLILTVESGLRAFGAASSEFVRGLVKEFTDPYRQRLGHESPTSSPSR